MTNTLITGGDKGIGYETARRLIEAGHTVWIGARDPERGRLAAAKLGASFALRAASAPSVINITSGLGSFTLIHDPERVESPRPLDPTLRPVR